MAIGKPHGWFARRAAAAEGGSGGSSVLFQKEGVVGAQVVHDEARIGKRQREKMIPQQDQNGLTSSSYLGLDPHSLRIR